MAGDYILPEQKFGFHARRRMPEVKFNLKSRRKGFEPEASVAEGRSYKAYIVIAFLLLAAILVWLFGIAPFRAFSRIEVSGYDGIGRDDVLARAGITGDSTYFSTNAREIEKTLGSYSFLESVRVFKQFPDRLQIILEGRRAVASALASMGGRTVPVLFDSQGVIFQIGNDENQKLPVHKLPVISGFVIEEPFLGMRLPAMFTPLFRELEKIEITAPELLGAVSELRINRRSFDGFDLVLYPIHKKVKVHISEVNEDLLRYTLLMVDILSSKEPEIESFDFRSGIASYIPKEAAP